MKQTYLSTFISGFDELVKKQLPQTISDAHVTELFDGLLLFESSQFNEISKLRFVNNSFVVLSSCKTKPTDKPETIVKTLISEANNTQLPSFTKNFKTFKVFVSKENQTISIARDARTESVNYLLRRTKLRLEPLVSDLEFWFIIRKEGSAYFAVRIPSGKKNTREKGELARELSHFLCLISEPDSMDVILDPFAGSGSIIKERITTFPFKHAIASDLKTADKLKTVFKGKEKIEVKQYNALFLGKIVKNSVDKIITDPPWGMFKEDKTDYVEFYTQMLREFERVLVKEGVAVILTARKEELTKALESVPIFGLKQEYRILVSGKKASIYKINKKSNNN